MLGKTKTKLKTKGVLLAALDIGSSKVSCFIGRKPEAGQGFEVLGVGHHVSKGIKNGTIIDMAAAEAVIRQTVHAAENMAADVLKGYPLREVIVNISAIHTQSHAQRAEITVAGHEITDNDIMRALGKAQESVIAPDGEIIHTIPVSYTIDGHEGIHEPRGMHGDDMGVNIHIVTGKAGALRNIAASIERSHLDITALCSSPYAAGLSALVADEMDLGCTVIDMGGGVTSIAVFQGGHVIFTDAVPIGGQHVTNDIAKGLVTSLNDAERIKVLYGSAIGGAMDEDELIDVPRLGEETDRTPNHIQRSTLIGIIQPRVEEIFEMVRASLRDSGLEHTIGRRVVLTGGASQLHGIKDLAAHVLDKKIRIGHPIGVSGLPDAVSGPAFATTAGLLTYAAERTNEMPAVIKTQAEPENLLARAKYWLKENW